jgi:hypothetical protein
MRNCIDSAQDKDLLESPYECNIEPPGSISHGVSLVYISSSRKSLLIAEKASVVSGFLYMIHKLLLLLLLSMLLISSSMDLWKIYIFSLCLIDKLSFPSILILLPSLAPNIFFCFSNHQGTMFFFFQLLSLPSSVLQCNHEEGNFFSEYDRSN